jgi:coatomer subunit gamma
LIGN